MLDNNWETTYLQKLRANKKHGVEKGDKLAFDALLHAMATKPPLGKPAKEGRTSNEADGEGCVDTQSPKDSSGDAS